MQANPQKAPDDLSWLFNHSDSELGLKSNFDSLILALKIGGSPTTKKWDVETLPNPEDAQIGILDTYRTLSRRAAASKHRRVMAAFHHLSPLSKAVFEGWFYAKQYAPELRKFFGEAIGILHLTETGSQMPRLDPKFLASAVHRNEPKMHKLRDQANALYRAALDEFEGLSQRRRAR